MKRIKCRDLLSQLELAKSGLSAREFIEQSNHFVFKGGKVYSFNDEVLCCHSTDVPIEGALPAVPLLEVLSKMEEEELTVEQRDKEVVFQGDNKKFAVVRDEQIFLPIDQVEFPDSWKEVESEFVESVALALQCVGTDATKFLLTCVHMDDGYVEACDNTQLIRARCKTGIKESVIVRGVAMSSIAGLAVSHIGLTDNWVHFKCGDTFSISCRRYLDKYPSLDKLLQVDGHQVEIPRGLAEATRRASVFAVDQSSDKQLLVSLRNNLLKVKGSGQYGWYLETKELKYSGPTLEFLIAAELLAHISDNYTQATIGHNRLAVSGNNWTYVTSLAVGKNSAKQ